MIAVYAGQMGSGKTLGMVGKALRIMRQFPTLPVYANFHIDGMTGKIESWKQLTEMHDCLVLLDEGHILFDSRDFKNNIEKTHFALQTRHVGLNVLITTQVLDQIDLRIRRVIDKLIICEKKYTREGKRYFQYSHLTPSALTTSVFKIGRTEKLYEPEKIWIHYNTKELIYDLKREPKSKSHWTKKGSYYTSDVSREPETIGSVITRQITRFNMKPAVYPKN